MESVAGFSGRYLAFRVQPVARNISTRRGIFSLGHGSAGRNFKHGKIGIQTAAELGARWTSNGTKTVKAFAALQTADAATEPIAELKAGQVQEFHTLPSGLKLEVVVQNAGEDARRKHTPLVFIHGSLHAAWCWTYHWMPFFSARGYDCYAVSFLGQGASDVPQGAVAGTLDSHSKDIGHFVRSKFSKPPVLIAHSLGGLFAQCYLSNIESAARAIDESEDRLQRPSGVVLAGSIPPSGNGPMVMRFLKRDLGASIKITLGFAAKMIGTSLSLCRDCLFSQDLPESKLKEYTELLKRSSRIPVIDIRTLSRSLPLPRPPQGVTPPILVLHAENDYVVDAEGSRETADWCGTEPIGVPKSAHDLMLDTQWEQAAQIVYSWLEKNSL